MRMKINWGTGLVIGMLLFIAFIMTMVIMMVTDDKYDHEMVTESYYEKGMVYQEEINAETNTKSLSADLRVEKTEAGWMLIFPNELSGQSLVGKIELYRPSNEKLDFSLPLQLEGNQQLIPKETLVEGNWNLRILWEMGGKTYLYKKELTY